MLVSRCFLSGETVFVDNLLVYFNASVEVAGLVMRSFESVGIKLIYFGGGQ